MPNLDNQCNNDALDGRGVTHDCGHNHCRADDNACSNHLVYERYRLQTFDNLWPATAKVDKYVLARNGFYYIGPSDRVQCVYCKIILSSWETDDIVEEEHKKHAPRCPFVNDPSHTSNFPLPYRRLNSSNVHHQGPKHREYAERQIRLMSFESWPNKTRRPTPGELAEAGFFYLGHNDYVKCFYCGGSLRDWKEIDDAWGEHRKWFPLCLFVAEHDPATHPELHRHIRRTLSEIAIANGYSEEEIQSFKEYTEENRLPYPVEYSELIGQLEQYRGRFQPVQAYGVGEGHPQPSAPLVPEVGINPSVPQVAGQANKTSSPKVSDDIPDRYLCKICYEKPLEMMFHPCKHVCCCQTCSEQLVNCPVCRTRIRGRLQIFFP